MVKPKRTLVAKAATKPIGARKRQSQATLTYVSPDLLDFDPTNPRFAGELTGLGQPAIQEKIYGEPHYASELVDSLLENGFIDYEPLVVKRNGARFLVIEGNRRLAAIKEIRSNAGKYSGRKSDLDSIPVLVFPEQPDDQQKNEMRVYLGVRHLLGFREWPPLSKAQYLDRESKTEGGLDRVIDETQLSKTKARRFLVPYRLLQDAGVALPGGEDFWVLGEALGRTGIKQFLQLEVDRKSLEILSYNKRNLAVLLNDLYGPNKNGKRDASSKVVSDTRDLSRLANVLSSDKAAGVLHSGKTLSEAEIYVDTREQSIGRLVKVTKELKPLLRKITADARDEKTVELTRTYTLFNTAVGAFVGKRL